MGLIDKVKNILDNATKNAESIVKAAHKLQKEIISEAQIDAENIVNASYNKQKKMMEDAHKKAESILKEAYKEQELLLREAKEEINEKKIKFIDNLIALLKKDKNIFFRLTGGLLKRSKKKLLTDIKTTIY